MVLRVGRQQATLGAVALERRWDTGVGKQSGWRDDEPASVHEPSWDMSGLTAVDGLGSTAWCQ